MGYNIYIIRVDSAGQPIGSITEIEWRELAEKDPEFTMAEQWSVTNPATGETLTVASPALGTWHAHPLGHKALFTFRDGHVAVSNPDEPTFVKMRSVADALGARVQGEEGEFYDEVDE